MKILVCGLTYGDRGLELIYSNLINSGYSGHWLNPLIETNVEYIEINKEGIANALNDGFDYTNEGKFDAIAFLSNDIVEPNGWLKKKVEALERYPFAGIVASSLDFERKTIKSEHIISNWLISMEVFNKIGYFNESMFPYGPIDLDYCERANIAGFNTYYVMDCLADHKGDHATGTEYGWDKAEIINKNWKQHEADINGYRNGTKNIRHGKRTYNKEI